jgi:hypothetical protein
MTELSSNYRAAEQAPVLMPDQHAVAELGKLRRGDLMDLRDRLDALPKMPWGRLWEGAAAVLIGAAIGGALAGWQLDPAATNEAAYWITVIAVLVLGCIFVLAALSTHDQRADSVETIKQSLDKLLERYPSDPDQEAGP